MQGLDKKRKSLVLAQRKERSQLKQQHQKRWDAETKARAAILPKDFKAIWSFVTGKYQEIKRQNEVETLTCKQRDREEVQGLIEKHITQRRKLQFEYEQVSHQQMIEIKSLKRFLKGYGQEDIELENENKLVPENNQNRKNSRSFQ